MVEHMVRMDRLYRDCGGFCAPRLCVRLMVWITRVLLGAFVAIEGGRDGISLLGFRFDECCQEHR